MAPELQERFERFKQAGEPVMAAAAGAAMGPQWVTSSTLGTVDNAALNFNAPTATYVSAAGLRRG